MSQTSDHNYLEPEDSPSPQLLQKTILERTQNLGKRQTDVRKELTAQGLVLKKQKQSNKQIKKETKLLRKDFKQIKQNKNWFRKLVIDCLCCCCRCCCCCCCCQCCQDLCQEKRVTINLDSLDTTTESEEIEPKLEFVEKFWNKRYEPKTWSQDMDQNLDQLNEEAKEMEIIIKRQNELIEKMNQKKKNNKNKVLINETICEIPELL
jgi:predicted ribosome quality control (RQC) complex YloA/Tae2 family protein